MQRCSRTAHLSVCTPLLASRNRLTRPAPLIAVAFPRAGQDAGGPHHHHKKGAPPRHARPHHLRHRHPRAPGAGGTDEDGHRRQVGRPLLLLNLVGCCWCLLALLLLLVMMLMMMPLPLLRLHVAGRGTDGGTARSSLTDTLPATLPLIIHPAHRFCCPPPPPPPHRSHLSLEDGGRNEAAPRPGYGDPSAGMPMAAGGRTPMHPGIHATPAHYSSHSTPMHPGMTPGRDALTKTPAYDPAWAATPAHPGFGSGTEGGGEQVQAAGVRVGCLQAASVCLRTHLHAPPPGT